MLIPSGWADCAPHDDLCEQHGCLQSLGYHRSLLQGSQGLNLRVPAEVMESSGLAGVSLKQLKEEFVSNLHGSTMLEIAALSAVVPAFVLLRQLFDDDQIQLSFTASEADEVKRRADQREWGNKARDRQEFMTELARDFVLVCVPTLACLTVFAGWVYFVTAASICVILARIAGLLRWNGQSGVGAGEASFPQRVDSDTNSRKTFLSSFRFTMMLVTCVSILAVDFDIFPRRYAKTETYGTGLMDLGVGSFVVANGLVSRQARNVPPSKYGGVLRNTSPLLVLGFLRLILTKGVDYQEHVAEYGVHWNFFFTLAAVALLTSLVHVPASHCGILGVIILGAYQAVLSYGLNEYLLSPERGPGIISLNKEGVFSVLGYWSIYLISVQLGHYLFSLPQRVLVTQTDISVKGQGKGGVLWWIAVDVWLLDFIFWLLAVFVDEFIERVSRRTCNLAYVTFVFAMNLEVIAIFLTADLLLPSKEMLLLQIFDRNLLATFLWSNILTGVVNMTVDTISASSLVSLVILVGYLVMLVGGMVAVESFSLKLKFW